MRRRGQLGLLLGMFVAAMLVAAVAYADTVQNDVATVGGVKLVTITAGDTTGAAVDYNIQETGGDSTDTTGPGAQRCNAADGTSATVTPGGLPGGVTATPGSVEFTDCTSNKGITFKATAGTTPGDYAITASVSDSEAVAGDYNTTPASFTLRVLAPSVVAPAVTKDAIGAPNHVTGTNTYVTSNTQLGFTVSSSAALSACTISIDGPAANDTSFSCVVGGNTYSLGGKLTSPPDGSYLNAASATNAGGTGSDSFMVILDNTAPSISVTGYDDGDVFVKGVDTLPTVGCSPADDGSGSGVAGQSGPSVKAGTGLNSNGVGAVTYQCTATDNLGNTATAESSYSVIYEWAGFFSPVENPGAWNSGKAGQSIPVKFSLGGDQGLSIFASGSPKVFSVACPSGGTAPDPIEEYATTTANSKLVYDALADQYNYVWKTDKAWDGKCFRLDVTLDDNTTHSAYFKFTK